jgi:hypothetical protein
LSCLVVVLSCLFVVLSCLVVVYPNPHPNPKPRSTQGKAPDVPLLSATSANIT